MKLRIFFIYIVIVLMFISFPSKKQQIYIPEPLKNLEAFETSVMPIVLNEGFISNHVSFVKKQPDVNSDNVIELFYGRKIQIYGIINNWYKISCDDISGYIDTKDVCFDFTLLKNNFDINLTPKGEHYIENVPIISQFPDFPTGCEAVSAVMALQYYGEDISVGDFVDNYLDKSLEFTYKNGVIFGPDPNIYFIGDPRSYSSYGCMSPVIEKSLIKYFGENSRVKRYKDVNLSALCAKYIDNDVPVILWVTISMIPSYKSMSWYIDEDEIFTWPANEHCVLLIGYDDKFYYVNDCYTGKRVAYPKDKINARYEELGCQSVALEK